MNFKNKKAILYILIFALLGSYLLLKSFAAVNRVVLSKEAETFNLTDGVTKISDSNASSGLAIKYAKNANATATVNIPESTTMFSVNARGTQCDGAPKLVIKIDNVVVGTANVNATSWTNFDYTKSLTPGSHTISLGFNNYYTTSGKAKCQRLLFVDKIRFITQDSQTTTTLYGTPKGLALTIHNGDLTTTKDGQIIDATHVKGKIIVNHANVIIKRSRVENQIINNKTGLVVEDTTIAPPDSQWFDSQGNPTGKGIAAGCALCYSNYTANRVEIYGFDDAFKAGNNTVIKNSYIHDLYGELITSGTFAGDYSHSDIIQTTGGSNITITGNKFIAKQWRSGQLTDSANAVLIAKPDRSDITNLIFDNNTVAGGNFEFYVVSSCANNPGNLTGTNMKPPSNVLMRNNTFTKDVSIYGGKNGIMFYSAIPTAWTGNVWSGGTPISWNQKADDGHILFQRKPNDCF